MRILTWNLQHGGGSRIHRIVEALESKQADVIVLSEFRHHWGSLTLRARLNDMGYAMQAAPQAEPRLNTVLIAARQEFEAVTFPGQMVDEVMGDFSASVVLAKMASGINVLGCYFPNNERKRPVFDFLLNLPGEYLNQRTLLIGDFNTGRHYEDETGATFLCVDHFEALLAQGWMDAWRSRNPESREFSWYSRGYQNGFRLDHALASPSLDARIKVVSYSHQERLDGISDHSMMIVDLQD